MSVLEVVPMPWGTIYQFECPGCGINHGFTCRETGPGPSWDFDGDLDRPTFSPSLLVSGVRPITDEEQAVIRAGRHVEPQPFTCHSFVRAGRIEFLGDCTHHLAGRTVDLSPVS